MRSQRAQHVQVAHLDVGGGQAAEVVRARRGRSPGHGVGARHVTSDLLAAYDDQLRTDAETPSALSVTLRGPLRLVTFPGARGFVTYRDLGGADADGVRRLRAMSAMADVAFGDPVSSACADAVLHRLTLDDGTELWVAEAEGGIVSAGRLELVAGTRFAGIWGGATLLAWRGRCVYRALTAARARSALRRGAVLVHSDSTEDSRPILERSGLVKVSTTTPYTWRPGA